MLEQKQMMSQLYGLILPTMQSCGFEPCKPENGFAGSMVYDRDASSVVDFAGEKGRLRLVFSSDRIHLLSGETDIPLNDDSAFNLEGTFLMLLNDYDERDVKSLGNEINDLLTEKYSKKAKLTNKSKNVQTVSKAAARSGALAYDPVTLATKLAALYPEIKDNIRINIDTYGEFLCEDYFVTYVAPRALQTIRSNDPQKMKKLFNILGDIYEDGTNEVQSLIAVTVLGPVKDDPTLVQNMMPYLTDTMLEPVLSVSKRLKKSKSANLRLENPPKYKPKKQKSSGGLMNMLMGGGMPQQ